MTYNQENLADDVLVCRAAAAAWYSNIEMVALERIIRCAEAKLATGTVRTYVRYPLLEEPLPSPGGYHRGHDE